MSEEAVSVYPVRRTVRLLAAALLCILASGAGATWWTVVKTEQSMRAELLRLARMEAQELDADTLRALVGGPGELTAPGYLRIKEQLGISCANTPDCRFMSLLGRREDGRLFFYVDHGLAGGESSAGPGQLYAEATEGFYRAFAEDRAVIEGPYKSNKGSLITALAPVHEPKPGGTAVLGVLCLGLEARTWSLQLLRAALPTGLLTLSLAAIVLTGGVLYGRRSRGSNPLPRWLQRFEPALIIAAGLALTLFSAWSVHEQEVSHRREAFQQLAAGRIESIVEFLRDLSSSQLAGLEHFFKNSPDLVSPEIFQRFTAYLLNTPGVQAWEWIPVVPAADRSRFEAAARAAGLHGYEVWQQNAAGKRTPATGDDRYYPVHQVAPLSGNEQALGFDLGSEALRRAALEEAGRTGLITATEAISLVQKTDSKKGMLICQPVFAALDPKRLRGFALAVLQVESLLKIGVQDNSVHQEIMLLRQGKAPEPLASSCEAAVPLKTGLSETRHISAFGKVFAVHSHAGPEFMRLHGLKAGWFVGATGLLLTAALAFVTNLVLSRRAELEKLVEERTCSLHESEQSYRNQFAENSTAMLLLDAGDGAILDANTAALQFYGYTREQLLAMHITEINTLPAPEVMQALASVKREQGRLFNFTHRLADGALREVEVSSSNIRFGGRTVLHSIIHDITERKRSEEMLQATTTRLELATRVGGVGIWDYDVSSNKLVWDEQMYRLYGITRSQFSGAYEAWQAGLHPEDRQRGDIETQMALQGAKDFNTEFRVIWRDGSVHNIRAIAIVQRDPAGKPVRMIGTNWDITAQKYRESQVNQLLQSTDQGIYGIDLNGCCTFINKAGLQSLGYTAEACLGRNMHDLIHHSYPDGSPYPVDRCPIFRAKLTGAGCRVESEVLWRKDGSSFEAEYSSYPLVVDGHITGAVITFSDITGRKRTQRELENYAHEMERKNVLLDRAVAEAEKASAAKSEFLANMSHEIRTPMNGVIGMTGLLLDTELKQEQRRYAEIIRSSGETLLGLINDILDFSKIEAGKLELELLDFDLRTLMEDFAATLALPMQTKGLTFTGTVDPKMPARLHGDPGRLRQVLTNLTGNALKFTRAGEIAVRADLVSESGAGVVIRFSVKDTGIGIAADKQSRLFQQFTQADASTTRQYGGTGLGLAISRQLAEMMGGEIGVISEEGRGSEFWFTAHLGTSVRQADPVDTGSAVSGTGAATHTKPVSARQPVGRVRQGTFRILLAEDNITNQQVAMGNLRKMGFRVDVVANGVEAVNALCKLPYDLVLMDCQMPEMDGYEATRRIRDPESDVPNHEIPVIAMTANAMQGDREKCLAAGMNDYIAKPVSSKALAAALDKWLPGDGTGQAGEPAAQPPAAAGAGPLIFDEAGLLQLLMGDAELAGKVVQGFLDDIPHQVAALRGDLESGDGPAAERQAHSIKGASSQVGAEALRAVAFKMEAAGQSGRLDVISSLLPELELQFERLRAEMEKYLARRHTV